MENDIKQHTLVFDKGLTNSPSDLLCDDDSLEICDGMTQVDGEWKAIQRPTLLLEKKYGDDEVVWDLMYVHRGESYVNYIILVSEDDETKLKYTTDGITEVDIQTGEEEYTAKSVVAIGNTLIVNTDNGVYYYLWHIDDNTSKFKYKSLGTTLPTPHVEFRMVSSKTTDSEVTDRVSYSQSAYGIIKTSSDDSSKVIFDTDDDSEETCQTNFNNLCIGCYEGALKKIYRKRGFSNPFFIRYAVELYDGTYTMISNPILMYPALWNNYLAVFSDDGDKKRDLNMFVYYCFLMYKPLTDYSEWSDIVKGVTVFMTKPVDINDLVADCTLSAGKSETEVYQGIFATIDATTNSATTKYRTLSISDDTLKMRPFVAQTESELRDDLTTSSVFYKLFDIGMTTSSYYLKASEKIDKYTLENITTQEHLEHDDYYAHCKMSPSQMYTFNRRLNLIGVDRYFFDGFTQFLSYQLGSNEDTKYQFLTKYVVEINTPSGVAKVVSTSEGSNWDRVGYWFYYPDPRAKKVTIYKCYTTSTLPSGYTQGHWYKSNELTLTEHKGLNGAYYISGIPQEGGSESLCSTDTGTDAPTASGITYETLGSYVIQSEVDNPFTFLSSGYVRVGQGIIIGLSGLTTALSQDAYKVATTICFTTQGIWALKIDSTGQYAEVAPPFSREVCVNAKLITMTDNAVFFASRKGLMCVTGTNEASVVCVSENIKNDYDFLSMLELDTTQIAYDYISGLIFFLDGRDDMSNFVYNIKTNTWSNIYNVIDGTFKLCVSDYPDTLLQNTDGDIYSLYNKPHRTQDNETFNCLLTSRPIKFEGAMILKSLRQIKHLKSLHNGTLRFQISGTNELKTVGGWNILGSVTKDCATWKTTESTGSLKGKPWRYYKLEYQFNGIKASDSFIGTVVVTQSRHVDKLR